MILIGGAVTEAFEVSLATLATLPRRELTADFHCVAGWSAVGLRWEGVPFATVYRTLIEPALASSPITHVVFCGLDGFRATLAIDDALGDDVLIAEQLDGRALDSDHGAPARLVSPKQYGYKNVKHLCRIEVHTSNPTERYARWRHRLIWRVFGRHPRARVWEEERHPNVPAWALRGVYRALIGPFRYLSAARPSSRRSRPGRPSRASGATRRSRPGSSAAR